MLSRFCIRLVVLILDFKYRNSVWCSMVVAEGAVLKGPLLPRDAGSAFVALIRCPTIQQVVWMARSVQGDHHPSLMGGFLFCLCRGSKSGVGFVAVIHNRSIICGSLGLGLRRSLPVHENSLSFAVWGEGVAERFRRMDRV